jgi:hypothetical protein
VNLIRIGGKGRGKRKEQKEKTTKFPHHKVLEGGTTEMMTERREKGKRKGRGRNGKHVPNKCPYGAKETMGKGESVWGISRVEWDEDEDEKREEGKNMEMG